MTTRLLVGMLTPAIRAIFFSSPCGTGRPSKKGMRGAVQITPRPVEAGPCGSSLVSMRLPCPCGQASLMPDRKTGRHNPANRSSQAQSLLYRNGLPRHRREQRFNLRRHGVDRGHAVDTPKRAFGIIIADQRRGLLVIFPQALFEHHRIVVL